MADDTTLIDLRQARESLERTNRALQILSACNRALVRATAESTLLNAVCRVLVEQGGYDAVWLGMLGDGDERLTPVVLLGRIDAQLHASIAHDWRPENPAPSARALRERRPVLVTDFAADPGGAVWQRMGYASGIFLPLISDAALYGLLAIYDTRGDAIDPRAAALLEEMAGDLSYGIGALRARAERARVRQALAASECNLRTVIERVAEGMLVVDPGGRVLYSNPAASELLGRTGEQLLNEPLGLPLVTGELTDVRVIRPGGTIASAEMRVVESEWFGAPARIIALHDTTAQRKAQEQVRTWARVFERSQEMILITDPDCRVVAANKAFEVLTGFRAEALLGKRPDILCQGGGSAGGLPGLCDAVRRDGHWQGELAARHADGGEVPLWVAISAATDEFGALQHYIIIASDIREKKAAEARIEHLAYHDALTGVANRTLLDAQLEIAIAHARRSGGSFGVLFVDLDRFKAVNDMLGHRAGDELLVQVAQRLRRAVRDEDSICRQGGDEFVVMLPNPDDPANIAAAAMKLLHVFDTPFNVGETRVSLSASIGIALYPEDGADGESLVHNADTAMYYAKEQGKNNFQFYREELNRRVVERIALENALRQAVERQELELYYQPQVSGVDGSVTGAEALLRWRRNGVLVEPLRFIDIAEESGLIVPIGEWVVEQACRQLSEWLSEGMPPLRIAVNLSASQFRPEAMQRLRTTLASFGIDPVNIELELTEGVLMQEAESSIALLRSLKESGISLAIDDFGTGYSSLNYLRRFPIDRLKVDQSFVRDLVTDPVDRAVTETIVALARSLDVAVVAEGVETSEEVDFLRALQCEELQGFYFSEPVPAQEFVRWWRERTAGRGADGLH